MGVTNRHLYEICDAIRDLTSMTGAGTKDEFLLAKLKGIYATMQVIQKEVIQKELDRPLTVRMKKLYSNSVLPFYAKPGDAAMDLYATSSGAIEGGGMLLVGTGVAMEIPEGYFGSIRERSGLARKGIGVGGGVVDSGYRGEVCVLLRNLSGHRFFFSAGERIAQMVVQPYARVEVEVVKEVSGSERGEDGFGSTGQ